MSQNGHHAVIVSQCTIMTRNKFNKIGTIKTNLQGEFFTENWVDSATNDVRLAVRLLRLIGNETDLYFTRNHEQSVINNGAEFYIRQPRRQLHPFYRSYSS